MCLYVRLDLAIFPNGHCGFQLFSGGAERFEVTNKNEHRVQSVLQSSRLCRINLRLSVRWLSVSPSVREMPSRGTTRTRMSVNFRCRRRASSDAHFCQHNRDMNCYLAPIVSPKPQGDV